MRRSRLASRLFGVGLVTVLAVGLLAGGCGSVRTELPASVVPPPPLEAVADAADAAVSDLGPAPESVGAEEAVEGQEDLTPASAESAAESAAGSAESAAGSTESAASAESPATTASAYKSPGEKHPLAGGTLAASYPRVGVRPPRGVVAPPDGQAWAVVSARFCAAGDSALDGALVDPARFQVEVPGQGYVPAAPDAPALAKAPLATGAPAVAPGTCTEGSIAYLVAGEGHIESITYDTGAGLLRWAT